MCGTSYGTELTVQPAGTAVFNGWSGAGCSGTSRCCTVTMSQAQSGTADFSVIDGLNLEVAVSTVPLVQPSIILTVDPGGFNNRLPSGDWPFGLSFAGGTVATITLDTSDFGPGTSVVWNGARGRHGQ